LSLRPLIASGEFVAISRKGPLTSTSFSFRALYGRRRLGKNSGISKRGALGMHGRSRREVERQSLARFLISTSRRLAFTVAGFVLVGIGLAGLLLPVLPGWLLIITGFAVLSREYYWARSCLGFCRRHAARGGRKLRTATARGRRGGAGREAVRDPSGEVVIDLTTAHAAESETCADDAADSRSSRAV
jgi:hypothetical protein